MQQSTPIAPDDTAETLHDRLAEMGSRLVVQTLDGLADGSLHPQPQPTCEQLRPAPKLFKPDCAIDWNLPGQRIVDFVRGLSPYPAATMQVVDSKQMPQTIKVYEVSFEPSPNSTIGQLITDNKTVKKVGVRDGFVHILSLQMSGKKRITVQEFLRGYDVSNWKVVI